MIIQCFPQLKTISHAGYLTHSLTHQYPGNPEQPNMTT